MVLMHVSNKNIQEKYVFKIVKLAQNTQSINYEHVNNVLPMDVITLVTNKVNIVLITPIN